jgi:hypothetical protein
MSKRRENETFADYRARCRAESKKAKKRWGVVRWVSVDPVTAGVPRKHRIVQGTYNKKIHGEIPELKLEGEENAT